jgi:hypothetical protein
MRNLAPIGVSTYSRINHLKQSIEALQKNTLAKESELYIFSDAPKPGDDLYNKEIIINHYNFHNQSVMEYFRHRPNDLLVINLAEKGAYAKFCEFIGKLCTREEFPWENRTDKIEVR